MSGGEMRAAGPMFEGAESGPWKSIHGKSGAHYNTYACRACDGMMALRNFFPDAQADEMNFALFSTSGVHGTYATIEEVEASLGKGDDPDDERSTDVTFVVVQPRICAVRYGNATPTNAEDIAFLKALRESSWRAVQTIGKPEAEARKGGEEAGRG